MIRMNGQVYTEHDFSLYTRWRASLSDFRRRVRRYLIRLLSSDSECSAVAQKNAVARA